MNESLEAWWKPDASTLVQLSGTTTSPKGRKLILSRSFPWDPSMDPRSKENAPTNAHYGNLYRAALRCFVKRRDQGFAYLGCELTICAPLLPALKVIVEDSFGKRMFVHPSTNLVLAQSIGMNFGDNP